MVRYILTFSILFIFASLSIAQEKNLNANHKVSYKPLVVYGPALGKAASSFTESFEDVTFPPAGWIKQSPDGGTGWNRQTVGTTPLPGWQGGTVDAPPGGGNAIAYATWSTGGTTSNDQWLITQQVTDVAAGDSLVFWIKRFQTNFADNVDIKISTTGTAVVDFTADVTSIAYAANSGTAEWVRYAFLLTDFVSAGDDIYVAFRERVADNFNDGAAIGLDLVRVGPEESPCPVDLASNPSPADGAADVSVNLAEVSWTNPGNATSNDFYWGTAAGAIILTQSGSQSSYSFGSALDYRTTYYWRVDEKNDTCSVTGTVWSFTTEANPDEVFYDDFEASTDTVPANWTVVNNGGTLVWRVFDVPWPNTYTLPTGNGNVLAGDSDVGGAEGSSFNSSATLTNPLDLSLFQTVMLEFDSDFRIFSDPTESASVEVSNDGTNWTEYLAYDGTVSIRNTKVSLDISATAALQSQVWLRFTYVAGWDWWWAIDNVGVLGTNVVPVELTSFGADVSGSEVVLNWSTATETNNKGFQVERKTTDGQYALVGFINGKGTTTETQNYSYADSKLSVGNYTYRLKQIDFDGTYEYSKEVEVEVTAPDVYTLAQNYPNPFNPSTKINFSLASDAAITLKIFDVLGQEVARLINGVMKAGAHEINFNASGLNSGVYLYKIEAAGIDGSNFTQVRKMILTK